MVDIKLIKRLVFDTMSLRQISPLTIFSNALSFLNVYFLRYNNQQHTEEALQSPRTMNRTLSLSLSFSLSVKTLINE